MNTGPDEILRGGRAGQGGRGRRDEAGHGDEVRHGDEAGGSRRRPRGISDFVAAGGRYGWAFIGFALALYLIGVIAGRLVIVVMPIIVGLLLTTLLLPPAQLLERLRLPRALSALVVVFGGFAILVVGLGFLVPAFVTELGDLGQNVRQGAQQVLDWLAASPLPIDGMRLEDLIDEASQRITENAETVTGGVLAGALVAVEVVTGLVLSLVLCFFFIKDRERITGWLVARTPAPQRTDVQRVGARAWSTLSGYLRGTAIVAFADAVGIGLGLLVIGVPLVLPLAVLTFFGGFFPIVGAFTAGLVATMVALVSGGLVDALLTLAVVVGVQQLESNVLEPVVLSRAVPLHPVAILIAITAGGTLGGILGAFVAVPLMAVLAAATNELRRRHPEAAGELEPEGGSTRLDPDLDPERDASPVDAPRVDAPRIGAPAEDAPGEDPSERHAPRREAAPPQHDR